MKKVIVGLGCLFFTATVFAWEGYDLEDGTDVDVKKEKGDMIEFYDYSDESHRLGQIQGRHVNGKEIEVYDYQSGEQRTFRKRDASPEAREQFDTIAEQEINRGDRHD